MKVLVETNFVLELVFSRDKFASCLALLEMAEKKEIDLLLPAYSFVEPNEAIIRRQKNRTQTRDTLVRELAEIKRSTPFEEPANQLAELTGLLTRVGEVEQQELRNATAKLLRVASVIDLGAPILREAAALQDQLSMSPQDAVVFASVLSALRQQGGPSCFITRNSKDFSVPAITDSLALHNCSVLYDFENGLNFVRSRLGVAKPK